MLSDLSSAPSGWALLTRLGEAQILLPAALIVVWALLRQQEGRAAARDWLAALAVAALLTTASKVAFIGWGLGSRELDFTGISGHAMFAGAIHPALWAALVPAAATRRRALAIAAGAAVALAVGYSRIVLGAHSASEVVVGLMLGAAVSAWALGRRARPVGRISLWMPALVLAWLAVMPLNAPPSRTHSMVTWLALRLSGHERPYGRMDLHRAPAQSPKAPRSETQVSQSTGLRRHPAAGARSA